jgi:SAM-dependent methyltransferase
MADADLPFDAVSPTYRRFILDNLSHYGIDPQRFWRPLPGADEMFFKALLPNYEGDVDIAAFKFTESTLRFFDTYRQIVDQVFGGFSNLSSVMDFASGYGRLTRLLEQRLRPEQIWVSDIYADAMAWQAKAFGVNTVVSAPDPDAVAHAGTHDIVFVGSLFSHLPTGLFERWLQRLYAMVAPGGVLAFSVHDMGFLPAGEAPDPSGLSFHRTSESGSLDYDIYGMSYVTEAYVAAAVASLPGAPAYRRFGKGAYENQDLYVVAGPGRSLDGLKVASTPMGGFETATALTNGDVEFAGWAHERTAGARIERLRIWVDGVDRGVVEPSSERPDVLKHFPDAANTPVGWVLRLARETTPAGALVRVDLESSSGLTGRLYAEFPPPTAITYSGWSRRPLKGGGL